MQSLFTGISGLNANMSALSVISNNIANINTVGFKTSRVSFADILSQTGGSATDQVGLGVNLSSIQRVFSQGAFETTGNTLDMAISGEGFFILKDSTGTYYSRAGQFTIDKNGNVVNPEGLVLQGYMANDSGVLQNTLTDIQLLTATVPPNPTSSISVTANLDSNSSITGFVFTDGSNEQIYFSPDGGTNYYTVDLIDDGGLTAGAAYTGGNVAAAIKTALESVSGVSVTVSYDDQQGKFTITNDGTSTLVIDWSNASSTAASILGFDTSSTDTITSGNSATSDNAGGEFFVSKASETSNFAIPITVYDSLGNSHVINLYFRKDAITSSGNNWEWFAVVDGSDSSSGSTEVQARGTITFDSTGALAIESSITYPTGGFDFTGGAQQNQTISFDFGTSTAEGGSGTDGTTQYGSDSTVSTISQDGYPAGSLQRLSIDQEGVITGIFSNGMSRTLAQVLLADFPSTVGLAGAGKNLFIETAESGQPLIGSPGSSGRGFIQASTLELSNVDLVKEFVKMIAAQRGFQANSRVITTTDDLLAELVNIKR